MQFNKLRLFQNLLSLSAVTLIIIVWATVSYFYYQNNNLEKQAALTEQGTTPSFLVPIITDTPTPETYKVSEIYTGEYVQNWIVYENNDYKFEFKYPPDWKINDYFNAKNPYLQIIKSGATNGDLDWTDGSVVALSLSESKDINLEKLLSIPEDVIDKLNYQKFSYLGWEGYIYNNGLQTTNPESFGEEIIATKDAPDGIIFQIRWSQLNYNNNLTAEKYFFPLLSTFKFTGKSNSIYTCPESGWIDCMPGPDKPSLYGGCSQNTSPEAIQWYQENCPDYQGIAY